MADLQVSKIGCGTPPGYQFDSGDIYNASLPVCRWGSVFVQPQASNNSSIAQNAFFNGSSWTRAASGYASGTQFYNGQTLVWGAGSGSGTFSQTIAIKTDASGNAALGGNVDYIVGSFSGARVVVLATGDVSLDLQAGNPRIRNARTPSSATAAGNTGEICWDANYLYVCTATNSWRRVAHSSW